MIWMMTRLAFDDEEQHPPEHYLTEAECLNVSQLQQQRIQSQAWKKLEETREYWDP